MGSICHSLVGDPSPSLQGWALILGASSGFGGACAIKLAQAGMDIAGVHLDRRVTLVEVEKIVSSIRDCGRQARFYNINAADAEKRKGVIDDLCAMKSHVGVLVHSLAFGALKPLIASDAQGSISTSQVQMTLDVMANTLVYWSQDVVHKGLMRQGGRIFAMTSAGSARVWPFYGAVSAAKAALESYVRQMAMELGPAGISVNAIRAGVTDTPALRKIPGYETMIRTALTRNPMGRLTTPDDIARIVCLLAHPDAGWMTGNVIGADGGEILAE